MTVEKYHSSARLLHWLIAILAILNIALGLLHDPLEKVVQLIPLHKSIGLSVLVLTLVRIALRMIWKKPPLPGSVTPLERAVAWGTHMLLYVLLLALPLTGWVFSSAGKYPLSFFGLFDWPKLPISKDGPFAGPAHEAHEVLGFVMLALVVLHVAAALRHHFVLKDDILRRML
ncbi:cytochrome b [Novosphingobium mangrovi (ex Huang et al. 2023)]|uniref:Cytochrome b n=1 Tax=Novosphingobium mangrovi (ex Huang et al. 2023) TaxID=2976432 RepID=A0ABT2I1S4_9SPHN|nr:cytochrome b [Novosphingobium mangrovi (ex Huang et al. 2023)]MCT2398760.1 cytochrome b [Novosphingobium mangrovi (ex Huang et al. 2023)]